MGGFAVYVPPFDDDACQRMGHPKRWVGIEIRADDREDCASPRPTTKWPLPAQGDLWFEIVYMLPLIEFVR
jgi:hypothetical protein